jgi:hypothetical protein
MNTHMRIGLSVVGCLAIGSCSSATGDATGPSESPPTVTLTASQTRVTAPGDIVLSASATGANGIGVQRVEFYERIMGVDPSPRKIGEDLEAPYEMKRSIVSAAENGDLAFTAKDYDVAGHTGVSNSAMVTVAVPSDNTPLQATVAASHTRITTPGHINFIISANKPVARAEIYVGATKVADVTAPTTAHPASVSVTRTDNGTHAYVVKVYDPEGTAVESAPMTVEVDIRWDFIRAIDGIHSYFGNFVATDATSSAYVAGTTDSRDVFLVKHDADGNRLWSRTLGGPDGERANSVGVDASGRIYVAATVYNRAGSIPVYDCLLAIYDAQGNRVRTQQIIGPLVTQPSDCVAASDALGDFYVAGVNQDSTLGSQFLIKYDRDGATLWTRKFRGAALTSIVVDALGGIYVGGYTPFSLDGAPNRGASDIYVMKFDADGNPLWTRQYGTAGVRTFGSELAADPDGGVYFAGDTVSPDYTFISAFLVRYGPDGALLWARTLGNGGGDNALSVASDRRGVYLVGSTCGGGASDGITEPGQGECDAFLAKYSRDGDLVSVRLLGTPIGESADGVAVGANGDLYVAGWTVYDRAATIDTPMLARHRELAP